MTDGAVPKTADIVVIGGGVIGLAALADEHGEKCGHIRTGWLHVASAPASVAGLRAALGESPPWDMTPFRPDRFGAIAPFEAAFRERCADTRARKHDA